MPCRSERVLGTHSYSDMKIVLILHNVRSVHNVGSLFRTANSVAIEGIFLTGYTPSPLDRFGKLDDRFAKVSLGSERDVSWEKRQMIGPVISRLRKDGFKIWAVEQSSNSIEYFKIRAKERDKIALILGNEKSGLSPALLKNVDKILEIPMGGTKESLNVGISGAIVLAHIKYVAWRI